MADNRRFKLIPVENLTPDQRNVYDTIRSGPRSKIGNSAGSKPGPIGGPFNVLLRSPGIGNIVQALGAEIRFKSSLSDKLNELAILVTARYWTSQYEWLAHCKLALDAGLDPAAAKAIAENRRPAKMDEDETIVYEFAHELNETKQISDATFKRTIDRFGERGTFDIIACCGYYSLISMCLNVDRTPMPDGVELPLKPL